jgi:hypothetical protein
MRAHYIGSKVFVSRYGIEPALCPTPSLLFFMPTMLPPFYNSTAVRAGATAFFLYILSAAMKIHLFIDGLFRSCEDNFWKHHGNML